jgi:hypothetical protein
MISLHCNWTLNIEESIQNNVDSISHTIRGRNSKITHIAAMQSSITLQST